MRDVVRRIRNQLAGAVPLGFLAVFFLYPVLTILWRGVAAGPGAVVDTISDGFFLRIAWFTLWQALLSTALTALVSFPLTWALARFRFPGRKLIRAIVTVPFVLPTVVVAGAFLAVLQRFELTGLRHSIWVVLAAHVFFNIAVFVRTVGSYWERLDRRVEDAARVLGATPFQTFREITFPRLRRPIAAALSIVFLFTFTSFGIILILGGVRMETIETEIYRYAINRGDFEVAAVLGIVQLGAVLLLVWWNLRLQGGSATGTNQRETFAGSGDVSLSGWRQWHVVGAAVGSTLLFVLVPIGSLVERSFRTGDTYGLANYRALAERPRLLPETPLTALANSLLFAITATGMAIVVGGLASVVIVHGPRAVSRILDLGLILPLGTSAVTLGFGMLITLDEPPLNLRQSWWIVPIAQALIGIPFVIRTVVPVLRSIDVRMREAAATLGADPNRIRREIDLPLGLHALSIGAGFAFAISLGEFGATLLLGRRGDLLTLPLAIERLLGQPGDLLRGQAMALAVILMTITAVVMLIADRSGDGSVL